MVGTINSKGKVQDASKRTMGYAKDVDQRIVAIYFFSDFLHR